MVDQTILIQNGHLVDPSQNIDGPHDILIENGRISDLVPKGSQTGTPDNAQIIDARNLHILPGLIDARVYVGEPGSEYRETISSASKAAAAGGITGFIMMPETNPVIDDVSLVDFVCRAARDTAIVNVYPSASITRGFKSKELTEFGLLKEAGAVMVTEGKHTISNAQMLRRALTYAKDFDLVVAQETSDRDLVANGVMNEGLAATHLGLPGIPREAEIIPLERDLRLAALTGGIYHAAKISTADSAKAIAYHKGNSNRVTAGISINHLSLNENDIGRYRTFFHMSPPLRAEEDRQAMIEALGDGTIDILVSSHDPQDVDTKRHPFAEAATGAIGLETLLAAGLRLVHDERITLSRLVETLSTSPAGIFDLPGGSLRKGNAADLILVDLDKPWVMSEDKILSKSKNSPFEEARFTGKVLQTLVAGRIIYTNNE
ncbi:MAG: dihydroorotase [Rhizobiaceae bacterium]|nr:dihydroorotase [Rhizobiaceae bacterium]